MQILTFERDRKVSNANSKHSKGIRSIRFQNYTIRKGFETFESKFKRFEKDSKRSNANSNHLKGIRSIRMQILTIQTKFETFKCKFEPFEGDSKHSNSYSSHWKGFKAFESKFEPFERSKNSNVNSNRSKEIRSIRMQIETIRKGFEGFEC